MRSRGVPLGRADPSRRLAILVAIVVLVDSAFFAALVPLLPRYAVELDLSATAAGLLSAAYAAGTLVGSLPGGWLAARAGVRPAMLLGLGLMSASSVAFAFAEELVVLDAARFAQGVGGACSFAAGLTWLVADNPSARRGRLIGTVLGVALAGVMLGPVLGAVSAEVGVEPVFMLVGAIDAVLAVVVLVMPAPGPAPHADLRVAARAIIHGDVLRQAWLVALPAVFAGALFVLAPLRLHALGAGNVAVGGVFLIGAALEAIVTRAMGAVSDRVGRLKPIGLGLAILSVAAALLPAADGVGWLAVLVVVSMVGFSCVWAPAGSLLSESAATAGLELGLAFALFNLAWAAGNVIGGLGGASLAAASSTGAPYAVLAMLCLATLARLARPTEP